MRFKLAFVFLALLANSSPAVSQTIRGSIYGTVMDATGAGVPGAKVRAIHLATNTELSFTTDQSGLYDFPRLVQFGEYRLEAEAAGFRKLIRDGINIVVDQRAKVDLRMEVGELTQQVQVQADAPLLETSNATPGQYISKDLIGNLPLLNRIPLSLVNIAPGVIPQASFGPISVFDSTSRPSVYGISNFSINGSRGVTNEIIVDGLSVNVPEGGNSGAGTDGPAIYPTTEATEELKILNNTFSSEYGKSGGGVVVMALKSGTNTFHGGVFEDFRNDKLNANPFFSNSTGQGKSKLRENIFGGSIGGPIWKDRTFFFFDYQAFRQVAQGAAIRSSLPTQAMINGDFSNLRNASGQVIAIYDPLTGNPGQARTAFPGNVIPPSRIDPTAAKILSFIPSQRRSAGDLYTALGNNTYASPAPNNEDQWDLKVDHNLTTLQHLVARYSRWTINNAGIPNLPGPDPNSNPADSGLIPLHRKSYQGMLGYTWAVNPRSIVDIRAGFQRYDSSSTNLFACQPLFNSCKNPFDPTKAGFPGYINNYSDLKGFPTISFTGGYQTLGIQNNQWYTPNSLVGQATWSRIAGRHVIKVGFDWRKQHYVRISGGDRTGSFAFSDAMTRQINTVSSPNTSGNAIASLLLGAATTGSISKPILTDTVSHYFAGFVQDDFKVSRKLTLNLGLRYDVFVPLRDRHNALSFFNPTVTSPLNSSINRAALPPLMNPTILGGEEFPNQGRLAGMDNTMAIQWKNFAPRVGIAYQAATHTVVRSGFAILYHSQIGEASVAPSDSFSASNPMVASLDGAHPFNTLSNPFPNGIAGPTQGSLGYLTNAGQALYAILGSNSEKIPYLMQWNLNIQQELPGKVVVEVGYTGSMGKQLNRPPIDINELGPQYIPLGNQLNQLVTNPFYGAAGIPSTSILAQPTVQLGQLLRPFPQFTTVTAYDRNGANSFYNGATVRVEKRFSQGLTLIGSFTGSKLLDNFSGIPTWLGSGPARDRTYYDTHREWAVNEEDVSRRLVVTYNYELPFGAGKPWLNHGIAKQIAGAWQISSIHTFSGGVPIQVLGGTTYTAFSAGTQRPNSTGKSAGLSGRAEDRLRYWFDTAQFTNPAPFTLGNVGRTLPDVRTDGITQWDFSVRRTFPVWKERLHLDYQAFFKNFLNHPDFAHPQRDFTSPDFGRVTSTATSPRLIQMQLALRF